MRSYQSPLISTPESTETHLTRVMYACNWYQKKSRKANGSSKEFFARQGVWRASVAPKAVKTGGADSERPEYTRTPFLLRSISDYTELKGSEK